MTILVTGASGFIGSFIVSEGLTRGYDVWAGVRASSSRRYLTDERLHFAELDLSDKGILRQQLCRLRQQMDGQGWDYVVHAAGATKCRGKAEFFETNTEGTRHLIEALQEEGMTPRRFVFISSLSIFGPVREQRTSKGYLPILDSDTPQPNTAYGQSKLQAEDILRKTTDFPFVILRPTGVYGPRERDYFLMAQSIKRHTDFAVGFKPQDITFVYVHDVVQAVYLSLTAPHAVGKAYFLSDGEVYGSRTFSDLLQRELNNPWVLHVKAPLWFLKAVCAISGKINAWMGRTSTLNLDKYHILSQRNWQCDISPAQRDLGYKPQWPLEKGVSEAIAWYRENGWL